MAVASFKDCRSSMTGLEEGESKSEVITPFKSRCLWDGVSEEKESKADGCGVIRVRRKG